MGAMLLIEVDGSSQAQVETDYGAIAELCLAAGAWSLRRRQARRSEAHLDTP